mmetsp:Transcript_20329/g.20447  ORF Transcript_20329/g.20447 Transcript_20329/m.20447 type:complete len:131 (-) Transcript_20329:56-448(-)
MWKANFQRAIKEIRFVVKPDAVHHGTWRFIRSELPEIHMLSPRAFISVNEITEDFKTESAIHFVYGDDAITMDEVPTEGLSCKEVVEVVKSKVKFGLSLKRAISLNNSERDLPVDIVEAHKYVKYLDDGF